MEALADRKRKKEKKAVLKHIRVKLFMFLFSAAAAAHTFFHFLCDAGSEIGAVLPTVAALEREFRLVTKTVSSTAIDGRGTSSRLPICHCCLEMLM
ncbi:hypothetical protein CDAR_249081 [Caerostris darwini]|uniref:Uncharacterized protein n=1 Tax=Caerostris darwini TaxID=1538125 RepID=A0AAV4RQM8_9ARAC|nr:hypothetical protein CDAR_249081 [Caerostris darwini]